MGAEDVGDGGQSQRRAARIVAADQGKLEVELVEAVRAPDVSQGDARAQRRLDRGAEAGGDDVDVTELDPAPGLGGGDRLGQ